MSHIKMQTWVEEWFWCGYVKCSYCGWQIASFDDDLTRTREDVVRDLTHAAERHDLSTLHPVGF